VKGKGVLADFEYHIKSRTHRIRFMKILSFIFILEVHMCKEIQIWADVLYVTLMYGNTKL